MERGHHGGGVGLRLGAVASLGRLLSQEPAGSGPGPALLLAVLLGGALGGLLRWAAGEAVPDGGGLPQTTLAINLVGSCVLALLPALTAVRRRPWLTAGLGPGLLGGFTTLSAASEQTRALLAAGDEPLALLYLVGSLAACVAGVAVVRTLTGAHT